jgi:hypothetical protein
VILLSLFLVLGSAAMLVVGLADGSQLLIWASIGASVAAALALTASVLRRRGEPEPADRVPVGARSGGGDRLDHFGSSRDVTEPVDFRRTDPADKPIEPVEPPVRHEPVTRLDDRTRVQEPVQAQHPSEPEPDVPPAERHPDPPGEPLVEDVSASDELRVLDLLDDVLVVDGRPRYHMPGCRHLIGRETVSLPISEARQVGFTPCAWCRPNATLADRSRGRSPGL